MSPNPSIKGKNKVQHGCEVDKGKQVMFNKYHAHLRRVSSRLAGDSEGLIASTFKPPHRLATSCVFDNPCAYMSIGIPPPPLPLCARNSFLVPYDSTEPFYF
jgi:hypothetical protein